MKSYAFLFWAYNVVWAGLAAWVAWLLLRLGRIDRRLQSLERELGREPGATQRSSGS